MHEVS